MKIGPGFTTLVTGAGSGIGKALALALAKRGANVSVVDFVQENGHETLRLVKEEHEKLSLHDLAAKPSAIFVKCDVTNPDNVSSTFNLHKDAFGKLDACINCAGIGEQGEFKADEQGLWRKVIDVNLNGVIDCTRQAILAMNGSGGAIVNVASAAGLSPTIFPIYSASKGGVVLFTKSLSSLRSQRIRANVLCPEFIETSLTAQVPKEVLDLTGGFIPMEKVVEATLELVEDEAKAGACLWLSKKHGAQYIEDRTI